MHLLIVLRDWLDVGIPAILSTNLFESFLSNWSEILFAILLTGSTEASSKGIMSWAHRIRSHAFVPSGWRSCHVFPVFFRLSQEWDRVRKLLRLLDSVDHFPSI